VQATKHDLHMYPKFGHLEFLDFCNLIHQDLNSCNFLQGKNAQKWILSSLLPRYTEMDSKEIYFMFF
jgi:hypothetical protein